MENNKGFYRGSHWKQHVQCSTVRVCVTIQVSLGDGSAIQERYLNKTLEDAIGVKWIANHSIYKSLSHSHKLFHLATVYQTKAKVCRWGFNRVFRPIGASTQSLYKVHNWLVVSTHLKNVIQNRNLSKIGVNIKKKLETTGPVERIVLVPWLLVGVSTT